MRRWIAAFGMCGALVFPTYAEDADVEFARALLKNDDVNGPELAGHLADRLQQTAARKAVAAYIRASVQRHLARQGSPERRVELYKQAIESLKAAQTAGVPTGIDIDAELAAAQREWRRAAGALPNVTGEQRVALGKEASATLDAVVSKSRAIADAAQKKVDAFEEPVRRFYDNEANQGKPLPREILEPLQKAFDEWMKAEREWTNASLEQVEYLDEADADKKKLAPKVSERCEAVAGSWALSEWPVLKMSYTFAAGRAYALILDYEKAIEQWNTLLAMEGATGEQALQIRKSIVSELSRLLVRLKRFDKFTEAIDGVLADIVLKRMFEQEPYRWIMPEYARAQAELDTPEKVENALALLLSYAAQFERVTPGSANEYRVAIGDVIDRALERKLEIKVTPQQWLGAATGTAIEAARLNRRYQELKAEGAPKAAEAQSEWDQTLRTLQHAADLYRRTIKETRASKDVIARVKIESQAWLELGNCLMASGDIYEAIVSYTALRDTFQPSSRAKWLPEYKEPALAKRLRNALAEVDTTVAKGVENLELALATNAKLHNNPKDLVNPDLRRRYQIDGSNQPDSLYDAAIGDANAAGVLAASLDGDKQNALKNGEEAIAKYRAAADKFLKMSASAVKYESSLYNAGQAYYLAYAVTARLPMGPAAALQPQDRTRELAAKALEAFAKYSDFITKNPPEDDEAARLRPERRATVLLDRTTLFGVTEEWERVIGAADEYLLWHERAGKDQRPLALFNKFRALIALSAARTAPAGDGFLNDAYDALQKYRELKAEDGTTALSLMTALQRRYSATLAQAQSQKLGEGAINAYSVRLCALQKQRLEIIESSAPDTATLDEYTSLLMHLDRCGKTREAVEQALAILKKFDPENKQARIPDDEKVWQRMLAKMAGDIATGEAGIIVYRDLSKQDRCRQEHRILVDYMYDTRDGRAFSIGDKRRPDFDRVNQDLTRAQAQVERIKKQFPDCQSLDPKSGDGKRSLLGQIEDEIDFRLRIEATRSKLVDLAVAVAADCDRDNDAASAKKWRDAARQHLSLLIDLWGETPDLLLKRAELEIAVAKFTDAEDTLFRVKTLVDNQSQHYFTASKRLAEVYALQKRWSDALQYPEFLKVTNSPMMKQWPELDEFIKKCQSNEK